jgi:EAL domain-containing protein (putative c-di-GMP-specific phosphodiesterase class I)
VTEDQVIRDIATAHEIATQLRIYNIALAIDDFGRGYSSLARLKELPFAELKLDQSFVGDCGIDPTNAALCSMAVELAHRFGSLAVAEGIEKQSDLVAIAGAGCDIGQGFIFAHAMPKEFLLARLMADGADGGFARSLRSVGNLRPTARAS